MSWLELALRYGDGRSTYRELRTDGDDVYWLEVRDGSAVVMRCRANEVEQVSPAGMAVGTTVHGYGGAAFAVLDGVLWFVFDGAIHQLRDGQSTVASPDESGCGYADLEPTPHGLIAVRERTCDGSSTDALVLLRDGIATVLHERHDFYTSPRLSPDGRRLAFVVWDDPHMPWDSSRVLVADFDGERLGPAVVVAGSDTVSATQPRWAPDGTLHLLADHTRWVNLYRWRAGSGLEPLLTGDLDMGWPPLELGYLQHCSLDDGRVACLVRHEGLDQIVVAAPGTRIEPGDLQDAACEYAEPSLATDGRSVILAAGTRFELPAVVRVEPTSGVGDVLRPPPVAVSPGSVARPISFLASDGARVPAFLTEALDAAGPAPLVVQVHGGPNAPTYIGPNPVAQVFAAAGFGFVDVHYAGSTGLGREFRDRLRGAWGVRDRLDCEELVAHLVAAGLADPERVVIRGASAGGYLTLAALAFGSAFAAGSCYAGVSDLALLAGSTHRLQRHHLDWLLGPLPDAADVYAERSPLRAAPEFSGPVLLVHGSADPVCPPEQATLMATALAAAGKPHRLVLLDGKGHGLGGPDLQLELDFYRAAFNDLDARAHA